MFPFSQPAQFTPALNLLDVGYSLFIAFICGWLIAQTYRMTFGGAAYSKSIANALVVLAMITAVVILVIGNNLARAFGLVGAMSIIRFRTAVKDPMDIVFIFFSLAIGLAAGVGLEQVAILGTLAISAVAFGLNKLGYGASSRQENLLQFAVRGSGGTVSENHTPILDQYCRKATLINVRSLGDQDQIELSYYIRLKDSDLGQQLVQALSAGSNISGINLFADETVAQ